MINTLLKYSSQLQLTNYPYILLIALIISFPTNELLAQSDMLALERNPDSMARVNPELVIQLATSMQVHSLKEKNAEREALAYRYKSKALYFLDKTEEAAFANLNCAQTLVNNRHTNTALIAECFQYSGRRYWELGLFELTKELVRKSLYYAHQTKESEFLISGYDLIGQVYFRQGDYEKALLYFDSCYQIDLALKDTLHMAGDLGLIGRVNTKLGRKEEGIKLLQQAVEMLDEKENPYHYSVACNALGLGYSNSNDFENARKHINHALAIAQEIRDTYLIINRYINLGNVHVQFNKLEAAETYLQESLHLMGDNFEPNRYAIIYENLGEIYTNKQQYQQAETAYKKALKIAEKGNMLPRMRAIYKNLALLYKENGQLLQAIDHIEKHQACTDSIFTINSHIQANVLKFKYETAQKEVALQALRHEKELTEKNLLSLQAQKKWLAFTLFLLALIGSAGFYILKQRQQTRLAIKEAKISQQLSQITNLQQEIAKAMEEKPMSVTSLSFQEINKLITSPLTEREFEILQLVLQGASNKTIAENVFISINTVKYHLKNIYTKLDVNNRVQAMQLMLGNSRK